jgi:hypothetical protein
VGVHYLRDSEGTLWLDPELKAMQDEIDRRLPNLVNMVSLPADPQAANVLVRSFSDLQPARYLIYNRNTRELSWVGDTFPDIKPAAMGAQEQVRYAARPPC